MTARVIDLRLRKIEKQRNATKWGRLSDGELDRLVDEGLDQLAKAHGSVQAAADVMRGSASGVDRELAAHLEAYIVHWFEDHPEAAQA